MNTKEMRLYFDRESRGFGDLLRVFLRGKNREIRLWKDDANICFVLASIAGRNQKGSLVALRNPFIRDTVNTLEIGYDFRSTGMKNHDNKVTHVVPYYLRLNGDGSITLVSMVQYPVGIEGNVREVESCTFFKE